MYAAIVGALIVVVFLVGAIFMRILGGLQGRGNEGENEFRGGCPLGSEVREDDVEMNELMSKIGDIDFELFEKETRFFGEDDRYADVEGSKIVFESIPRDRRRNVSVVSSGSSCHSKVKNRRFIRIASRNPIVNRKKSKPVVDTSDRKAIKSENTSIKDAEEKQNSHEKWGISMKE